jgi:hypothetical protein
MSMPKMPRENRICVVCNAQFVAIVKSSQKCCSTHCGRRLSAENGKRYLGKNDRRRTAPTCVQLDERFCEAMKLAGYVMTGPAQTPCTDNPLDLTRGWQPEIRSTGEM